MKWVAANYNAVSQRGVVFFRNQDIGIDQQKILGQKLGELTGKPASSKVGDGQQVELFGAKKYIVAQACPKQ